LRKQRSLGITRKANMSCGDSTLFESLAKGVRSRYAKYTQI